MVDDEVATGLVELRETVAAQTAGLMRMLSVLATQTAMLKEILTAVKADNDAGESPIAALLKRLVVVTEGHSETLERIENSITASR